MGIVATIIAGVVFATSLTFSGLQAWMLLPISGSRAVEQDNAIAFLAGIVAFAMILLSTQVLFG